MKKAIVISALTVLVSASVFAQGIGSVSFGNALANPVRLMDGVTLVPRAAAGGTYFAELMSALDGADFATASRQGLSTTFNSPQAGVFLGGGRTVPTTANGGFGQFMVRVWDTRGGATYDLARQNTGGFQFGDSGVFRTDTADAAAVPIPTPAPLGMPAFNLTIIPEPSVIGLGLLGAGALLLLRRRK
jgi:hypothetical protein